MLIRNDRMEHIRKSKPGHKLASCSNDMLEDVADSGRHHERSDGKFSNKFRTAAVCIWDFQF